MNTPKIEQIQCCDNKISLMNGCKIIEIKVDKKYSKNNFVNRSLNKKENKNVN
jgi:uncharacterized protein YlzI (FlbEa/FlbD family)